MGDYSRCYVRAMASITKAKRVHKTLTVNQKLKLLNQIGKKSYTVLCEEYGIG